MPRQPPSAPRSPRHRSRQEVQAISALVALCVAVLLLVLVVPGIRQAPFAQGLAGLVMALLVAVVIFALFPAPARLKVPLSLATASGFYLALLPRIKPFIFPVGHLTGEVRYEGTSEPVAGAEVRLIAGQSTTTDARGAFVLRDVRSDVTELVVSYRQFDTTVTVDARGVYPVVPKYEPIRSASRAVGGTQWTERRTHGCAAAAPGRGRMRMFVLAETLSTEADDWRGRRVSDTTFHLRLRPTEGARIAIAAIREPDNVTRLDVEAEAPAWHWFVDDPAGRLPLRIEVCVAGSPNAGPASLQLNHWLEGIERRRGGTSP